eukprot:357719-Chlamydomonas_euryale.AAC.5
MYVPSCSVAFTSPLSSQITVWRPLDSGARNVFVFQIRPLVEENWKNAAAVHGADGPHMQTRSAFAPGPRRQRDVIDVRALDLVRVTARFCG